MYNLIILTAAVFFILYLPGLILFRMFFSHRILSILESFALFFTLSCLFFIVPGITSYILNLSWTVFIILWGAGVVILLLVALTAKVSLSEKFFETPDKYDLVIIAVFISIAAAMYVHGGHFTGDATFHLSSIIKLLNNKNIDPYIPIYKDYKVIPYSYAYNILYIILAFINKITGLETRIFWDLSPAVFSVLINSGIYFFSRRLFKEKKFVFISLMIFYFYQYIRHWIDFKFLPYPDQIARNVFLFIALGSLFFDEKNNNKLNRTLILTVSAVCLISLTHMYSFFAFFYIAFVYMVFLYFMNKDRMHLRQVALKYITALIACIPFVLLRLIFSNYDFFIKK